MKKLYLVRHAKSSWEDPNLSDQQRPLNKRGLKNAPEMGARMAIAGVKLDRIITSPAQRALHTARFIAKATGYGEDRLEQNDDLYFNGLTAMLNIIRTTDDNVNTLMLVGHNPDMTAMLNSLCGYQVDNMPTCAIACIGVKEDSWADVDYDECDLLNYNIPKNPPQF